ncbi:MAG: hypothetical protein HQ483_00595 [Rhodospirillales bacterium]|nr:hypothetical protein [Rhodospirillales bacterium]
MTALEEVPVATADPDTLAIYQRLMSATGSGSPALIFRHMAATPGLLNWVWRTLGDDVEAGWVQDAVWNIVAAMPPVPIDPIGQSVLAETGIDADARSLIRNMLTSYNRMNPVNLVLIGAIRALISGAALPEPARRDARPSALPPPRPPDLPPPPKVASLEPDLQNAIRELCRTLPDIGVEVTPTLYRHFAIWPRFMMAVAHRLTAQLDALDRETHAMNTACVPLISELAQRARTPLSEPPPITGSTDLVRNLEGFGYLIPHLVVVGRAVEAALPE